MCRLIDSPPTRAELYIIDPTEMIALFLVLFASLAVAGFFLGGFLWSAGDGQFEDQEGAALRMLQDDPETLSPDKTLLR